MAVLRLLFALFSLFTATALCNLQTIYQFPNETWVENLAVRGNGNILVTLIGRPEVWEINVTTYPATAALLHTFPLANSVLGIAEYGKDSFAVNVGNFSVAKGGGMRGSWSVWSLDLSSRPVVRKIASLPQATLLNGMASLPANPSIILTADSTLGQIFSVNLKTGSTQVAVSGSFLRPNASANLPIGVNGIQFRPGNPSSLYFDNTSKPPTFASVPIDPTTGQQAGPIDVVVGRAPYPTNGGAAADDFTFDSSGSTAWVGTTPSNELVKINICTGEAVVAAGGIDSEALVGPTSCKFGRLPQDVADGRLYITTNGGLVNPPPSGITGGKLVAFDTKRWIWNSDDVRKSVEQC